MIDKQQIVNQARTWLNTRFQHQGRIKKSTSDNGAVDCIGLIIGIASELGIKIEDKSGYSRLPEANNLLELSKKHLKLKSIEQLDISDIVLLKIEEYPQHFGIIGNGPYGFSIIHSYAPLKKVVEHHLDHFWQERIVGIFEFPNN